MVAKIRRFTEEFIHTGNTQYTKEELVRWINLIHSELVAGGWEHLQQYDNPQFLEPSVMDPGSDFPHRTRATKIYRLNHEFDEIFPLYMEVQYREASWYQSSGSNRVHGIGTTCRFSHYMDEPQNTLLNPTPWLYTGLMSYSYGGAHSKTWKMHFYSRNDLKENGRYIFTVFDTTGHALYYSNTQPASIFILIQLDLDESGNPQPTGFNIIAGATGLYNTSTNYTAGESPMQRITAEGITEYYGYGNRVGGNQSDRVGGVSYIQPLYFRQPHLTQMSDVFTYYIGDMGAMSEYQIEYAPEKSKMFLALPQISQNVSGSANTRANLLLPLDGEEY